MPEAASNERHARSIASGLFLAVVLACGAFVSLDVWRVWDDRAAAIATDKAETTNLARSLSQHVHDTVQAVDTAVVAVREAAELEGLSSKEGGRLDRLVRNQVAALPTLYGIIVLDAAGGYVVNSTVSTSFRLNNSDTPYFQYHRDHPDRGFRVGDPVRNRTDGRWVFTVSRRLDAADGSFAGVVVGAISVSSLQQFYSGFDIGAHGSIVLMAADGIVVARAPSRPDMTGSTIAGDQFFTQILPRSPSGTTEFASALDGVLRISSYQRIDGLPLIILVSHARSEVLAAWRSNAAIHLVASSATAAMLSVLGGGLALQMRRRLATEARLREQEGHYRMLAENVVDLVIHFGADLHGIYVSPASRSLLGYEPSELVALHPSRLVHAEDWTAFEAALAAATSDGTAQPVTHRVHRKDGSVLWVEAAGRRMQDGQGYVVALRDITRRKKVEQDLHEANVKLQQLVMLDGLTGIGNRRSFDAALDREFHAAQRGGLALSLLLIDIDHFKRFNDSYGHLVGDECLRVVAATIDGQVSRSGDHPARYGGEEFAMLLPHTEAGGAAQLAERLCEAVRRLDLAHIVSGAAGGRVGISVSIGAATLHPAREGATGQTLVNAADKALYAAKQGGRDRVACAEMPCRAGPAGEAWDTMPPAYAGRLIA